MSQKILGNNTIGLLRIRIYLIAYHIVVQHICQCFSDMLVIRRRLGIVKKKIDDISACGLHDVNAFHLIQRFDGLRGLIFIRQFQLVSFHHGLDGYCLIGADCLESFRRVLI